jgi:hypothetical protein
MGRDGRDAERTGTSRSSAVVVTARWRALSLNQRTPIRPPPTLPTRNEPIAVSDAQTEIPPAPAIPNPRKTTLPVMFATKTWPSFK